MASASSVVTVKTKRGGYGQRRLGPAPFASFEDLSDDLESPEEKSVAPQPLPGIKEDVRMAADGTLMSPESTASGSLVGGGGTGSLQTPSTPRIDISRASSSSHHDSNNSSPERELFTGTGEASGGAKLGLGFKEEGTADLRSSTEELDYHEPETKQEKMPNKKLLKYELEAQSEKEAKERKDSACSDVGFLSISGRTSRLSSVGSAASGGSAASHISHLSVVSGLSRASSGRSPSPHKMLLETSFCGNKPIPSQSVDLESSPSKHETESLEKVLLSRSVDPTRAAVIQDKELQKPLSLNLSETGKSTKNVQSFSQLVQNKPLVSKAPDSVSTHFVQSRPVTPRAPDSTSITPSASPKLAKHAILKKKEESGSRTPSPSLSRKSSFSIFKKNETMASPESPTVPPGKRKSGSFTTILKEAGEGLRDRSRSRSKSRERVVQVEQKVDVKGKKDNKNKGVFSNLFKKKEKKKGTKSESENISPNEISSPESKLPAVDPISNVEFTFDVDNIQPSEFGIIRKESFQEDHKNVSNVQEPQNGIQENLLPSESVMLPAPSQLISELRTPEPVEHSVNLSFPVEEEFLKLENQPTDAVMQEHLSLIDEASMQATPSASEDVEHLSSESERDSEVEYLRAKVEALKKQEQDEGEEDDHERKRLVFQQDSFEDELPYVPTTLPQERSVAVPIVPVKQRVSDVRTCPTERPRSTTPINPSLLEEYVQCSSAPDESDKGVEKIRISLPREDSIGRNKLSRRGTITAKSWVEFAEHGLQSPREFRKTSPTSPPPPLPPRAQPTPPLPITPPPKPSTWINFDEIPEKRKPAKRIQTIPSRGSVDLPEASKVQVESSKSVVYSYVNPEDCKCECHEATAATKTTEGSLKGASSAVQCSHQGTSVTQQNSSNSDVLYDDYAHPYLEPGVGYSEGLKPMKPFGMDLDVSSNRSSIISQDEPQSPEASSPMFATRAQP
ncbi:uncharacterized protein LOC134534737 [Bacillus rossius redtenbacheri]|uniref:uncharacterized protein LOC134534737 n=1 Tax=Bacillus rossius redtenbacheri TaxID=93214 RepID=UPI002FDEE254